MKVTDKDYFMEKLLTQKLDLMINRMTGKNKQDNLILIDGDEGLGKTNMAAGLSYYISNKTGRSLTLANLFFDLDDLIKFTQETKEQIIWWDEGALGGLANEWWKKNQKKFMKLLMVARKKRHFFIICIPKFFRLNEYFVVDRSIALIHVYARNNIKLGRFVYFTKDAKENLYYDWKRTRKRSYKKHYVFGGSFPEILGTIINEKEYDKKKDIAILSIDSEEERRTETQVKKELVIKFIENIMKMEVKLTQKDIAKGFNITERTIRSYYSQIKE